MGSQLLAAHLMMSFLTGARQEITENLQAGSFETELAGQLPHETKSESEFLEGDEIPGSIRIENLPLVEAFLARLEVHADTRKAAMSLKNGEGTLSLRDLHGLLGREDYTPRGLKEGGRVSGNLVRELLGAISIPGQKGVVDDAVRHISVAPSNDVAGVRDLLSQAASRLAPHAPTGDSSGTGVAGGWKRFSGTKSESQENNGTLSLENSAPRIDKMIPSFMGKDKGEKNQRSAYPQEVSPKTFSSQSLAERDAGGSTTVPLPSKKLEIRGQHPATDWDTLEDARVSGHVKVDAHGQRALGRGGTSEGAELLWEEKAALTPKDMRNLPGRQNLPQNSLMDSDVSAFSRGDKFNGDSGEADLGRLLNLAPEGRGRESKVLDGEMTNNQQTPKSINPSKGKGSPGQGAEGGSSHSGQRGGGFEKAMFSGKEKPDSGGHSTGTQPFFTTFPGEGKNSWVPRGQSPGASLFETSPLDWDQSPEDSASLRKNYLKLDLLDKKLGRLMLEVETRHHEVAARLMAETEQARSVILQNSATLRQELQSQGLVLEQFQVHVQGEGSHRRDRSRQEDASNGSREQKKASKAKANEKLENFHGSEKEPDRLNGISFFA